MVERTDTHVEWQMSPDKRCLSFSGALNQADLVKLRLDDFDRQVVMSPMTNAADLFQTLEIVFRRMAEQAAAEPETV